MASVQIRQNNTHAFNMNVSGRMTETELITASLTGGSYPFCVNAVGPFLRDRSVKLGIKVYQHSVIIHEGKMS